MSIFLTILFLVLAALALVFAYFAHQTRRLAAGAEQIVPQAGQVVTVGGGAIHYVEQGPADAPVVVLIHGLSGQLQHMTYGIAPQLADSFRVISVDRPGCGYSERDSEDLAALSEQARMLWEFLDKLDVEKPVLAGHSLGGALSLAMALQRPDGPKALALMCPATHPEPNPSAAFKGLEMRSPRMRRFVGATLAVPMARKTAAQVLEMVFAPETCPEDFMDRGGAALGLRPKAFVTASSDYNAIGADLPDQASRYGELTMPGWVLYGADDAILSPDLHGKSMQDFGLGYEELPGRGHMIPITAPDECAAFIRRVAETAGG